MTDLTYFSAGRPPVLLLPPRNLQGVPVEAWLSRVEEDGWDAFLERSPLGQFQQSTRWARVKRQGGWRALRVLLIEQGAITGGFQVLVRPFKGPARCLGSCAYISKGPVLPGASEALRRLAFDALEGLISAEHVRGLIVQPPDGDGTLAGELTARGFLPNCLKRVNSANLVIDLRREWGDVERDMRKSTRKKIRQAATRGVRVREGSRDDLPTFFRLMKQTCERQGVQPNPATEASLCELWDAFHPDGKLRLAFACVEDRPVAGLLSIVFGRTVTLWKKGWSCDHADRHPNEMLHAETIAWARQQGYESCNFAGMAPDIARAVLSTGEVPAAAESSRDYFNLGFGGTAVLLPPASVLIPSGPLRFLYRTLARVRSAAP